MALDAAVWDAVAAGPSRFPSADSTCYELSNTTFHRLALRTIERLVADDGAGVPQGGELARVGPTGFNGVLSSS